MEAGRTRITSDGTIEGSVVEVLGADGTWTAVRLCKAVTIAIDTGTGTVTALVEVHQPLVEVSGATVDVRPYRDQRSTLPPPPGSPT